MKAKWLKPCFLWSAEVGVFGNPPSLHWGHTFLSADVISNECGEIWNVSEAAALTVISLFS